ncbi:MAG: tubulin-like doman-containing protein [Acutalibacteraceae bacterium]|nr:tubulin-like doman-containing protein [Acutalibacteraceae bacterium]
MAEKCFCYCIGGTGARIAEVAAHLCTMNMLNDKNITFIVVDKDEECGGTKRAKKVISYTEVISEIKGSDSNSGRLCRSRLSSKEDGNPTKAPWNFTKAIENIQGNNNGNASLKNALGGNNSDNEILFDAFYSKSEQENPTSEGFYGHPSIGALMFKYMMKNTNDDIAEPVLNYLTGHTGDVVKVFIIGSVFGGTGASVFSNLAAHIRDKSSGMNNINNRLLISGVLLLPYFSFGASTNENPRINDMEFFAKSRTALEQYSMDNFMRNLDADGNYKGNFDTIYICGQNPLHKVGKYSEGGSTQENHFDLVDLIAAYAMVDFFKKDFMQAGNNGGIDNQKIGKIYEYRLHIGDNLNQVLGEHLSGNLAENLSKMLLFAAFVITKVYAPFKSNNNIKEIRLVELTYGSGFSSELLSVKSDVAEKIADIKAVTTAANANGESTGGIGVLYQYCAEYVKFVYDIAYNGKDWSKGTNDYSEEYKLLNQDYIEKLYAICGVIKNKMEGDVLANFIKSQHILDSAIVQSGKTINDVETAVQGQLKDKLKEYKKNGTGAIDRFGDYVKAAFEACFN